MGIVRRWVILPLIGSLFVVCSGKSWGAGDCRSWVRAGFRTILFGNTPREQSFRFSSSEIILGDKNIPAIGASLGEVFSIQSQQGQNARGYWRTHKAGDRVVGVEIRNIKNLNESILGISQTEMFLEAFKIRLHQRLQNYYPGRGIVFSNFKRLFVWFPADLNVFRSDVLEPVIEKVAEDVAGLAIATGRDFNWPKFLRENVSLSEGKSKGIASLNLSLQNTRRIPRAAWPMK